MGDLVAMETYKPISTTAAVAAVVVSPDRSGRGRGGDLVGCQLCWLDISIGSQISPKGLRML